MITYIHKYKYKEKLVIFQLIGIIVIKVEKQEQLSTSANILVDMQA